MKKIIVNEKQRGILFKNGKLQKLLTPGRYFMFGDSEVELLDITKLVSSSRCTLMQLLQNDEIKKEVSVVEVGDQKLALHYVDGKFAMVLPHGMYAFWAMNEKHEFKIIDIQNPEACGIPEYIFAQIPTNYYIKLEVSEYQKARLFFNQKFVKLLDAGTYYFWRNNVRVDANLVDTRLTKLEITGQEIMTQDKVSLRINFVCNYKITDYVRILTEIDNYIEQLHVLAQLAIREYVGKNRLDDILANKEEMAEFIYNRLKEKEASLFLEISDAGVKDIILPGEIREIMNTVLIAEKRAQANVITRREEVASTRSLLNTAKLMEENKTLYQLKELEYIEKICEKVGNINLNGNGGMLSQLMSLTAGKE